MKLIRLFLFPLTPIYALVVWFRNKMYDKNWFESTEFSFPVIVIGNISTGGTGKTPMTEYVISLLRPTYNVAVLSRGYKRKSSGFILADEASTVLEIGDEPYQIHAKFKDVKVAVNANRVEGIKLLREECAGLDVILLDDAFQHRALKAGLNILLTPFNDLCLDDFLLPTGNLRESKSGIKRADIIVVTKTPEGTSLDAKHQVSQRFLKYNKPVFFSEIIYSEVLVSKDSKMPLNDLIGKEVTLVTGIANPESIIDFVSSKGINFNLKSFSDHHNFTDAELKEIDEGNTIILTTEKDYVRMRGRINSGRLFYLPITIKISESDKFESLISQFVQSFHDLL